MKYKNIIILLIFILSAQITIGNAITITDPVLFEIYSNTTYITIYNQTADSFTVSTSGHYLDILLNETHFNFTTTTNTSLTNISSFNNISTITTNTTGILTTNITTNNSLKSYSIFINGILSNTVSTDINGNLQFNYEGNGNAQNLLISESILTIQQIQILKSISCNGITGYELTAMGIFSIALMIFGFMFVLYSLRMQNYIAITSGIMVVVIGFAMLLLGNYILTAIFGVLC